MQFVTGQVLVDVARLDDVVVLELRRVQAVAVVRNVHLALAHQFPVVTVRCAGEHVVVVRGAQAVRGGARAVVRNLRGAANAALAGVVDPRQARLLHLVQGLVHQQDVTGQARRRRYLLLEVGEDVAGLADILVTHVLRHRDRFLEADRRIAAVGLRHDLNHRAGDVAAVVAGQVVPQRLHAILGQREGVVAALLEVLQTVAVIDRLDEFGAALDGGVDVVGQREGAVGLVYRDLVGIRVALEHRQLAGGKLVLVLVGVLRGDGEQRLFIGEGVGKEALAVELAGGAGDAAGPGRDAAVGVAFLLRAHGRQGRAQLGHFVGGHRRHHATGQQAQGQRAALEDSCRSHVDSLSRQVRSSRRS